MRMSPEEKAELDTRLNQVFENTNNEKQRLLTAVNALERFVPQIDASYRAQFVIQLRELQNILSRGNNNVLENISDIRRVVQEERIPPRPLVLLESEHTAPIVTNTSEPNTRLPDRPDPVVKIRTVQ